jgi:3-oxocholest-4-en-26-oate---CoA ligase
VNAYKADDPGKLTVIILDREFRLPEVLRHMVVGVPDETWGERVVAVVATGNTELTATELQDTVRRSLAGYKVPRAVVLLPGLPRTPTGKLEVERVKAIARAALGHD